MKYKILKTPDYEDWLKTQPEKFKYQIAKRLSNIENEGHFGLIKDLGSDVWEMKW